MFLTVSQKYYYFSCYKVLRAIEREKFTKAKDNHHWQFNTHWSKCDLIADFCKILHC